MGQTEVSQLLVIRCEWSNLGHLKRDRQVLAFMLLLQSAEFIVESFRVFSVTYSPLLNQKKKNSCAEAELLALLWELMSTLPQWPRRHPPSIKQLGQSVYLPRYPA